jgi:predicted DsbA family dithiol-disulfide isomerase
MAAMARRCATHYRARRRAPHNGRSSTTIPTVSASAPPRILTVDVISDVVCPWCFIGRRRLGAALAALAGREPGVEPRVRWHPFQLNPDLPREGIPRRVYLEAKFGGRERANEIYERVRAAGRTVGIDFAFDLIERQPNTLDAHRLIAWAQSLGSAENVVERLFRAYFLDGRAIGERAVLAAVAGEAGLDPDAASAMLASDEGAAEVAATDRRVRELGVTGVPFFIFAGRLAVAGAQEPDTLVEAMAQAAGVAGG